MFLTNFKFSKDHIGIEMQGRYFDLHNLYDFQGYETENDGSDVFFVFNSIREQQAPRDTPESITIQFQNIDHIEEWKDSSDFPNDGATLDEVGFYLGASNGRVEYNGSTEPFENGNLLVFRFLDGTNIAIVAENAICRVSAQN